MQITFDTNNARDLAILEAFISTAMKNSQPEVEQNTGSTATGSTLSPEGSGVSGAGEAGAQAPETPAPAPEKKVKAKKSVSAKEETTEAPTNTDAPSAEPSNGSSSTADKPTIDTVRAALQAFTASKGVPAGIELLQKFGAGRISELAEEHYTAFIEGCAA